MLDHMVEHFRLRRSTGEQSKSAKGNWYYWILQMGKEKRDARLAVVTPVGLRDIGPLIGICMSQPEL